MKEVTTISINVEILEAARLRAREENSTLSDHIERLIRHDLGLDASPETPHLVAPDDGSHNRVFPLPGETAEDTECAR